MNARLLISNTHPGIARAYHDGDAWRVEHLLPDYDVRSFAHHPDRPGVIWAGTQGQGLLRSDDEGLTWQQAGLSGQVIKSIAISPSHPDIMYAGLKPAAVAKSADGGNSWTVLDSFQAIPSREEWWSPAEPPGTAYVQGLAVSPENPDLVVAGIEYGAVVRSTDGGASWSDHCPGALRDCHALVFHPVAGKMVYESASGGGGAISEDGGATWSTPTSGLDRHYGWGVAVDAGAPSVWYVSVSPGPDKAHSSEGIAEAYIYRWQENGWQRLAGGLPEPLDWMPYALISPQPDQLYAGLRNGDVWFTSDRGRTWRQIDVNLGMIDHALLLIE